jgi:hypothetical protein
MTTSLQVTLVWRVSENNRDTSVAVSVDMFVCGVKKMRAGLSQASAASYNTDGSLNSTADINLA